MVKKQLEAQGYTVLTAGNGQEALKALNKNPVDLLITDVVMPKMDGVDLYAAVKNNPAFGTLPIIIVTDKTIFKESFTALGVSHFVEKTTDLTKLLEKIKAIGQESTAIKKFSKILITSSHNTVLLQMSGALKGMNYLVTPAQSTEEILSKAVTMKPHAIVMDVLYQDTAAAPELIRALRCFSFLNQCQIITYAYFPEELGMDVEGIESLKTSMQQCTEAGADHYIGRFNQSLFAEKLIAYGI